MLRSGSGHDADRVGVFLHSYEAALAQGATLHEGGIDLSHLNEACFDEVARLSDAPPVATHSNAHAITPSSRNLTDRPPAVIPSSTADHVNG